MTKLLGTYPYMAPEFFNDQGYSISVDVWALGVMYHEMLFGELYFIGQNTYSYLKKYPIFTIICMKFQKKLLKNLTLYKNRI